MKKYQTLCGITREELLKAPSGILSVLHMPNKQTLKTYNLIPSQYEDLLRKQNFVCGICKEVKPLVIDHDHVTGHVRGLLCVRCNTGMGFIDAGLSGQALEYRKRTTKDA
jgi:hypothetical protein